MPNLYVIGGANGSGKTTVALTVLPRFLQVFEYANADEIAAGLSPRYERGLKNFIELYLPIADGWMIFDNSGNAFQVIAKNLIHEELTIYDSTSWNKICRGM